jgi:lipooligosaccharide transport system permease protein
MRTSDVVTGEVTWALRRGAAYSAAFPGVWPAMGLILPWWAVLALPVVDPDRVRVRGGR